MDDSERRACRDQVRHLQQLLGSSTKTHRKEGMKSLLHFLDSPRRMHVLDEMTMRQSPLQKLEAATWPALCVILIKFSKEEMAGLDKGTQKRGVDAQLSACFKKLVEKAEDSRRRCGRGGMLRLWMSKLCEHLGSVMRAATLDSQIGRECIRLLCKHLLSSPAHMAHVAAPTAHELLELCMGCIQGQDITFREETRNVTQVILQLLLHSPGELSHELQASMLRFLSHAFQQLYRNRSDLRAKNSPVTVNLVSCANSFLLRHGADVRSDLPKFHSCVQPFMRSCWDQPWHSRLKEAIVTYLRVQMWLGILSEVDGALDEARALLRSDIQESPSPWFTAHKLEAGSKANKVLAIHLAADVWFHAQAQIKGGEACSTEESEPPRKRARAEPPVMELLQDCLAAPLRWLPVAVRLLQEFGNRLPLAVLDSWRSFLHEGLDAVVDQCSSSQVAEQQAAFWKLHLLSALVRAWRTDEGRLDDSAEAGIDRDRSAWLGIWDRVLEVLETPAVPASLRQAAYEAATAMLSSHPLPSDSRQRLMSILLPGVLSASGRAGEGGQSALAGASDTAAAMNAGTCLLSWQGAELVHRMFRRASTHATYQEAQRHVAAFQLLLRCADDEAEPGSPGEDRLIALCDLAVELVDAGRLGSAQCAVQSQPEHESWLRACVVVPSATWPWAASSAQALPTAQSRGWLDSAPVKDSCFQWTSADSAVCRKLERMRTGVGVFVDYHPTRAATCAGVGALPVNTTAFASGQHDVLGCGFPPALAGIIHASAAKQVTHTVQQLLAGDQGHAELKSECGLLQAIRVAALAAACATALRTSGGGDGHPGQGDGMGSALVQLMTAISGQLIESLLQQTLTDEAIAALAVLAKWVGRYDVHTDSLRSTRDDTTLSVALCMCVVDSVEKEMCSARWERQPPGAGKEGGAAGDISDDEMFDSDEDEKKPGDAPHSSAPAHRGDGGDCERIRALELADTVAWLCPDRSAVSYKRMHRWLHQMPEIHAMGDLVNVLIRGMAQLACAGSRAALSSSLDFISENVEHCVVHPPRCQMQMDCLHSIAYALTASGARLSGDVLSPNQMDQVQDTMLSLTSQMGEMVRACRDSLSSSSELRVKHAATLAILLHLNSRRFADDDTVDTIMNLLYDSSYFARVCAAKIVRVILDKWSNTHAVFGSLVEKFHLADSITSGGIEPEYGETAVFAVVEAATERSTLEGKVLYLLLRHAAFYPLHRGLVAAAVHVLGERMGYGRGELALYMAVHRTEVAWRWIAAGHPVEPMVDTLPRLIDCGEGDAGSYMREWLPALTVPVLLYNREAKFEVLAVLAGAAAKLVRGAQQVAAIAGVAVPMTIREGEAMSSQGAAEPGAEEARAVLAAQTPILSGLLTGKQMDEAVTANVVHICSYILGLVQAEAEAVGAPFVSGADAQAAIHHLAQCAGQTLWQWLKPAAAVQMLHSLHTQLAGMRHPSHMARPLRGLKALVELLADGIRGEPYLFSYAVRILSPLLGHAALRPQACRLLRHVVSQVLRPSGDGAGALLLVSTQSTLTQAIAACVEHLETDSVTPGAPPGQAGQLATMGSELFELLEVLTTEAPPEAHIVLARLPPFPDLPALEEMRRIQDTMKEGLTVAEELQVFVETARSQSATSRQNYVAQLLRMLRSSASCLGGGAVETMHAVAWQLVHLGQELQDDNVSGLAGHVLSLAGPLRPSVIAFLPAPTRLLRPFGEPEPGSAGGRGQQKVDWSEMYVEPVLTVLAETMTTSPPVAVLGQLHGVLFRLLAPLENEDAAQTLQNLGAAPGHADALAIFCGSKLEGPDAGVAAGAPPPPRHPIESDALWSLADQTYSEWVCNVAYTLLNHCSNPWLTACAGIAHKLDTIAEALFPYILIELVCVDGARQRKLDLRSVMSKQVTSHVLTPRSRTQHHIRAITLLLEALHCLHSCGLDLITGVQSASASEWSGTAACMEQRGVNSKSWPTSYWLELDYMLVAEAAVAASSTFTALRYLEAACNSGKAGQRTLAMLQQQEDAGRLSQLQELLLQIYGNIDEPDSIQAVATLCETPQQLLQLQSHSSDWHSLLAVADRAMQVAAIRAGCPPAQPDLWAHSITALTRLGCTAAAHACLQQWQASLPGAASQSAVQEMRFEAAWRNSCWSATDANTAGGLQAMLPGITDDSSEPGFHEALARGCTALREGDAGTLQMCATAARVGQVRALSSAGGIQSASALNQAIVRLQMVEQLEGAWARRWPDLPLVGTQRPEGGGRAWQGNAIAEEELRGLQEEWQKRREHAGEGGRYALFEPLAAFSAALAGALGCRAAQVALMVVGARAGRKAGQLARAGTEMARLRALSEGSAALAPGSEAEVERLKLLWAEGRQRGLALAQAQRQAAALGAAPAGSRNPADVAKLYGLTAKWMAAERAGSPAQILGTMEQACRAVAAGGAGERITSRVHYRLAAYAYKLYKGLLKQQGSRETVTRQAVLRAKIQQLDALQQQLDDRQRRGLVKKVNNAWDPETRQLLIQKSRADKEVKMDKAELNEAEARERQYLSLAMENYGSAIHTGSRQYDLMAVFRLCDLWFKLGTQEVNSHLRNAFSNSPSYKFLPLVYQMASRMSNTQSGRRFDDGFYTLLDDVLFRLAQDHPHHTLYQVLALRNGDCAGQSGSSIELKVDADKVAAAAALVERLRQSEKAAPIIAQMEVLLESYVKLASMAFPENAQQMRMPGEMKRKLRKLDLLPPASYTVEVQPNCEYSGTFPTIEGVGDRVNHVGGINRPKQIEVIDSNLRKHRELVKSRDDLRQDAVMQQLFGLVNELLRQDQAAYTRHLRIETYKVVPFTPDSGVVGWVEDTMPLMEYLRKAHVRYACKGDLAHQKCGEMMRAARPGGAAAQRKSFDKICRHFLPVFRHFFLEMYRHPSEWFQRRLAYTRSVAVNSMVGYIIGLGDRHSSNILLQKKSAEVVHIDLGIAFEQGKLLTTPEQVPFRLTRDLVDGMGVTACEGVMRRCSEHVLRVLRAHREELLTIAEVLIHDPLYNWALTPKRAAEHQRRMTDTEGAGQGAEDGLTAALPGLELGNIDAERALTRVKQKLEGTELGDGEPQGVEGQVQQLLHDAQDPDKLCRMFEGWAAWM